MTNLDPLRLQAESRIGQVLGGKWKLERLIGIGGMATVYAASHRNGRKGAVKMLHPEMSLNEEAKTRFLREGYAANKVDHPGAVRILDDDVNGDGAVYLVMELLEGDALDELMLKTPGGRIPEAEAVRITIAMLDVLETAHKMEIIHRDLKPDNVFVTKQGAVKILDFGIARVLEQSHHFKTQIGSLLGTPNFMPPEQALGEHDKIDARTDIWATGATMFAMLTGRAVHLGDTPNKMLFSAMSQPAPPVRSIAPNVSQSIANVVDKALAFEREKRWSSAAEMRLALKASAASIGAPDAAGSGADAGAFGPNRTLNMNKEGDPTPAQVSAPQAAPSPVPSSPGASPAQSPAAPPSTPGLLASPSAAAQPRVPDPGTLHRSALTSTAPGNRPRPNPLVVGIIAGVVLTTAAVVIWKATSSKSPVPSVEAASTADATEAPSVSTTPAVATSSPRETATSAAPASSADVTTSATASARASASAAPSAAVPTTSSAAPLKGQLPSGAWTPKAPASSNPTPPPPAPSAPPPAPQEAPSPL